uniref:Venom serine protease n=1 Tax=Aphidius ervi TaxID=37627 RepID=A0A034WY25_APHER
MTLAKEFLLFVLSLGILIQCVRGVLKGEGYNYKQNNVIPARVTLRSNDVAFCDGVAISTNLVLTSASCLIDNSITYLRNPSTISVTIVTDDRTKSITAYKISEMFYHKNFTINNKLLPRKDIAVLKLVDSFKNINQNRMKDERLSNNPLNINDTVFMYGLKSGINSISSQDLLKVYMTIQSPETCAESLRVNLDCKQLCAIVNSKHELFRRDRGAAVFIDNKIAGIISHMDFYNNNGVVVITNVVPYLKWINYVKNMKDI